MNWQHLHILAAVNYLRERIASGAPDPRAKDIYEGLLDVLTPARIELRQKRQTPAPPAAAAPRKRARRATPAKPRKRPRTRSGR